MCMFDLQMFYTLLFITQLDEVMEKEPYKIARELLEKYEPSHSSLQPFAGKGSQETTPRANS